jgi:hypothetical protein
MDNLPSLSLPVVGDRVEVLWEGGLYAATVTTCHSTGEYDVVYEKGGAEGTFVTREKHQLLPLEGGRGKAVGEDEEEEGEEEVGGDEEGEGGGAAVQKKPAGPKKRVCYMEGCTKGVKVRDACILHGAYGMCLIGDCTTMAVNKTKRCAKHGAKGLCTVPGCATNAQARGLCAKHGGGSQAVCVHPGCTTKAQARGLCFKHGGCGRSV